MSLISTDSRVIKENKVQVRSLAEHIPLAVQLIIYNSLLPSWRTARYSAVYTDVRFYHPQVDSTVIYYTSCQNIQAGNLQQALNFH